MSASWPGARGSSPARRGPPPEGAATLSALKHLINGGDVDRDERVVLFNTGSGLKYTDLFEVEAPVFDVGEKIDYKNL
jgi:threonine synthase